MKSACLVWLAIVAGQQTSDDRHKEDRLSKILIRYQSLYKDQCSSFKQSDLTQWPQSSVGSSNTAQNLFSLGWDVKTIIKYWEEEKYSHTSHMFAPLPDQYKYEIYSRMTVFAIIFLVTLMGIMICCCQVFCVSKYKVFMRCCYVDVQTDTKSNVEKYFLFFMLIFLLILIFITCGLAYIDQQIEVRQ